jgi:transcription initiation factor TFIID subunit 12
MMGQPAIQQTSGYVLESESQHVLSKKKLRELVMQVTGGSDSLTPDIEEVRAIQIHSPFYQPKLTNKSHVFLDLADTFIDQIVISACKVAKLRQSPYLEFRDLQLVLERNYNIRIPGYSSDAKGCCCAGC